MMDGGGGGGWWMWGGSLLGFVIVVLVVVVVVDFATTSRAAPRQGSSPRSAGEILAERFARGEIDEDEYRKRRDALGL
jgi:putative membrane protein